jgi:hypothetical protein
MQNKASLRKKGTALVNGCAMQIYSTQWQIHAGEHIFEGRVTGLVNHQRRRAACAMIEHKEYRPKKILIHHARHGDEEVVVEVEHSAVMAFVTFVAPMARLGSNEALKN